VGLAAGVGHKLDAGRLREGETGLARQADDFGGEHLGQVGAGIEQGLEVGGVEVDGVRRGREAGGGAIFQRAGQLHGDVARLDAAGEEAGKRTLDQGFDALFKAGEAAFHGDDYTNGGSSYNAASAEGGKASDRVKDVDAER
jgi:hypothetical protein